MVVCAGGCVRIGMCGCEGLEDRIYTYTFIRVHLSKKKMSRASLET